MFKNLICLIFGHKYVLAQRLTAYSRRVYCTGCGKSFAMNDEARVVVD